MNNATENRVATYQLPNGELSSQKDVSGGIHFQVSAWPSTDVPLQADVSFETASTPEEEWQAAFDFMKTFYARRKALDDQADFALRFFILLEVHVNAGETYDDGVHLHGFCCQLLL